MESDDLLSDPAGMLSKYCGGRLGYRTRMPLLKWDPSPASNRPMEVRVYATEWFRVHPNVLQECLPHILLSSTGPVPAMDTLTEDIKEAVEISMPYYEEMYKTRLL